MNPRLHFASSLVVAIALYPLLGLQSAWVMAGGFLIDVDHYFWGAWKTRSLSLSRVFRFYRDWPRHREAYSTFRKDDPALFLFHTWQFCLLVLALLAVAYAFERGFLFTTLFAGFSGLVLHLALDAVPSNKSGSQSPARRPGREQKR